MGQRVIGVLVAVVMCSVAVQATDWTLVFPAATKGVIRLEAQPEGGPLNICSGVVINADAGFLVTAAHCVEGKNVALTVNGRHAELVRSNRVLDLAVLRFTPKGEIALKLSPDAPKMGEPIAVIGYAFGSKQIQGQPGHVVNPFENDEKMMRVAVDVIGGDSGGACINARGELVGIVSGVIYAGPMHLGVMVPLEAVEDFVQAYIPRKP